MYICGIVNNEFVMILVDIGVIVIFILKNSYDFINRYNSLEFIEIR